MSQPQGTKISFDHRQIQSWAEERKGKPVKIKIEEGKEPVEVLKLKFPGEKTKKNNIIPLTWEEFFNDFDREKMALQYQDETPEGDRSKFYKFIYR